jgi:hypothetical protein
MQQFQKTCEQSCIFKGDFVWELPAKIAQSCLFSHQIFTVVKQHNAENFKVISQLNQKL